MDTDGASTPASWSRREVGRATLALAGGWILAGCQTQRPTIQSQTNEAGSAGIAAPDSVGAEQLRALLDRRAQALQAGDEQGFLADLDQSNQDLLQRERLRFANLRQFQLNDFGFITERLLGAGGSGAQEFSPVLQVTQLTADAGPGGVAPAEAYRYMVAAQDGNLVVNDVVPLAGADAQALNIHPSLYGDAPWNRTPLRVLQAGNVWLAADDSVPDLETYAAAAEAQVGAVEALWGDRPKFPGYVMFLSRNEANIASWYGLGESAPLDLGEWEGIEIPLQGVRTGGDVYNGQYAGARIVVNLASIAFGSDNPESVMRHELAHAVTTRGSLVAIGLGEWLVAAPRWAIEGFARWVQALDDQNLLGGVRASVAEGVRAGKFTGTPPGSEEFYSTDVGFNYNLGASVFRYVEQTTGRDAAVEFYARVIQHTDSSGGFVTTPAFDGICQQVVGAGSEAFLQNWGAFVRGGA